MLDHVSITVSDIAAAERFYDAIMKVLGVVKVGRREDWLGYGERARPAHPERVYISIRKGAKPEEARGRHWCFKAKWRTQVDAFWDEGIAAGGREGRDAARAWHRANGGRCVRCRSAGAGGRGGAARRRRSSAHRSAERAGHAWLFDGAAGQPPPAHRGYAKPGAGDQAGQGAPH